jgi:broad specificity phosphatase PhoE
MGDVWLVRHGATEWSESGRHTSTTDLPLLPSGEAAARALAPRLAGRDFALVLCSPRDRARVTAGLAGFDDLEIDDDLVEVDYGDYEGLTTPEIRAERPGWSIWEHGAPGGETVDDAGRRADRVIERVVATDGDVLVFAHGHLLRILAARWLGEPAAFGGKLLLSTGSVSELDFERERRAIALWNDTSHHP